MKISKTKFVLLFLVCAFAFQFTTNSLLGLDVRLFPQQGESFLGTDAPLGWKSAVSAVLLPLKIILVGPLLPYIEFLRQEPDTPPPFFLVGFAFYWTILALALHYLAGKIKNSMEQKKKDAEQRP